MSQHNTLTKFTTVKGAELEVDVLMGWDRPLQQQFLVVEVLDFDIELTEEDLPETLRSTSDVDEGIVYSNLCDEAEGKDLQYFKNKLNQLGIKVPESMFDACEIDQQTNADDHGTFHEFPQTE